MILYLKIGSEGKIRIMIWYCLVDSGWHFLDIDLRYDVVLSIFQIFYFNFNGIDPIKKHCQTNLKCQCTCNFYSFVKIYYLGLFCNGFGSHYVKTIIACFAKSVFFIAFQLIDIKHINYVVSSHQSYLKSDKYTHTLQTGSNSS